MPSEFTNELIAGTVGGWAQVAIGHPFDTVKVLLQTNSEYKNAWNCFQRTVQSQGIVSLYKGSLSPFIGFGICNAVVFSANGFFKRQLSNGSHELSLGKVILAGGCSGAIVSIINCPFELVKVKLQTSNVINYVNGRMHTRMFLIVA
jgi:solute carrier family 25 carnitine/acylcarnitine transporter 20/29